MNREIKFRGKMRESGEWVYGYYAPIYLYERNGEVKNSYAIIDDGCIGTLEMFGCGIESGLPAKYEIYTDTLGQYTGLRDKNGVEIYEGDIVDAVFEEDGVIIRNRAQVVFDNGCWVIKWQEFKNTDYLYDDIEWLEVIGNIYDNPELLEEEGNA